MCRKKIHLLEHSAMFGFAWTDADSPVVPGELFSASGWIACYPQVPHRAAAGAAFQVVTSEFESSRSKIPNSSKSGFAETRSRRELRRTIQEDRTA
jgi:hypothetical protein